MLAHGAVLRSNIFSDEEVEAIARDYRTAGLDAVGAEPDPAYGTLPSELREALAIGRPFVSS
jgi:hypothetical protein